MLSPSLNLKQVCFWKKYFSRCLRMIGCKVLCWSVFRSASLYKLVQFCINMLSYICHLLQHSCSHFQCPSLFTSYVLMLQHVFNFYFYHPYCHLMLSLVYRANTINFSYIMCQCYGTYHAQSLHIPFLYHLTFGASWLHPWPCPQASCFFIIWIQHLNHSTTLNCSFCYKLFLGSPLFWD